MLKEKDGKSIDNRKCWKSILVQREEGEGEEEEEEEEEGSFWVCITPLP